MSDTIKNILLPTDFSELGDYAYTLASYIASHTGASIDIVSVTSGPAGAFYSTDGRLLNDEGNDYSEWTDRLDTAKAKMNAWTRGKDFIASTYCTIGDVDNTIIRYAMDHKVDLIIMGTDGLYSTGRWTQASHAEFISNHSPVPVLTLKCDRSDISLNEIILVGDFLVAKAMDLAIVKGLQSVFGSKLLLLKVKTINAVRTEHEIETDMTAFARVNDLSNYELCIYHNDSVEAGIGKFAAERDVDLIALGTHQKKGFSKLFRRSISDDVVNHLFHPVLTFPIT